VVCGALTWFSVKFVADSLTAGDTLLNGVPAWPLQLIMPIAFALITYRFAFQALRRTRGG
jgi:TRAP-type C4-dicarboxylate transport system permease small subunit